MQRLSTCFPIRASKMPKPLLFSHRNRTPVSNFFFVCRIFVPVNLCTSMQSLFDSVTVEGTWDFRNLAKRREGPKNKRSDYLQHMEHLLAKLPLFGATNTPTAFCFGELVSVAGIEPCMHN